MMAGVRIYHKTARSRRWYIEFTDHRGALRRIASGTPDKGLATWLGNGIERIVGARSSHAPMPPDLAEWIDGPMPQRIRLALARWGIIDKARVMAEKPLREHLEAWKADIVARGRSVGYAEKAFRRVKRLADACGWGRYGEINPQIALAKLAEWRQTPRGLRVDQSPLPTMSAATSDHHVTALKVFAAWMVRNGRAHSNGVAWVRKLRDQRDIRRRRRALTAEELGKLLKATKKEPERWNMEGPARALLYRVAAETGLRSTALRSLTPAHLRLDDPPLVSAFDKGQKLRTLPLRPETAELLRKHVAMLAPAAPLFRMPNVGNVARMLRDDLAAAGIAAVDAGGAVLDFHALRHTFGTMLAKGGVHPKAAQDLMGHSSIELTMRIYTHTLLADQAQAIAKLPEIIEPPDEEAANGGANGGA